MSTILHLSDLHLGDEEPWERATDDKSGVVPQAENSRLSVLETALTSVKRLVSDRGQTIDCVVVTGDLTSEHASNGFERWEKLLEKTGVAQPESIVVVPGNHDVDWSFDPGTRDKYASFLKHTRGARMRTPLCDGVDIEAEEPEGGAEPILELDDAVIVAINSANWCGTRLKGGDQTFDIARVSEAQLGALTEELRALPADGRLRIAATHHHLLPVTDDEETKPFEAFTNLARLRSWLKAHGFHAVMHGHKHAATLTWDHIYEFDGLERPPRRLLLVSGPRPTTWGEPICRLLQIGEPSGRRQVRGAPQVVVETLDAERGERPLSPRAEAIQLDGAAQARPGFVAIDAMTADAAYERLVYELRRDPGKLHNVVCIVRDAPSAETPPTNFKLPPTKNGRDVEQPGAWLDDTVKWWQRAKPELVATGTAPFNHGERLRAKRPGGKSALERAASLLGSTKALALVLRPGELEDGQSAPAFVAVQLVKASDEHGDRLDCVGYFRKQDLTLWWPVNVAELRAIQKHVLDLDAVEGVREGSLVTIAVEAVHDDVMPQLTGTHVDRAVDLRPEVLMRMAYQAAHGAEADRESINALWARQLGDIGSTARDFPSLGIDRLIRHLKIFVNEGDRTNVELLIKRLQAVYDRAYRARAESSSGTDRQAYADELFDLVGLALEAVDAAITQTTEDDGPEGASA